MIKKRIGGVITVYNGLAVQSFGFKKYLPLGNPVNLAENLSRWGADEIILLDIKRTKQNLGPNLELLKLISNSNINTPLTYGGGIASVDDAVAVISAGAERIILDSLLHTDLNKVCKISNYLGSQAIVGSFPLGFDKNGTINWYHHVKEKNKKIHEDVIKILQNKFISEVMIIDKNHEGTAETFDKTLIEKFPVKIPVIAFGGLSIKKDLKKVFENSNVVSAVIGNSLNYTEHSIQKIKLLFKEKFIRKANFSNYNLK